MKRRSYQSSPRLLALDLDGTLTKLGNNYSRRLKDYFFNQQKFERFLEGQAEGIDSIINEVVNDTPDALFARIIKASLNRGDKVAITTFNMSPKYCEFVLAMMGLNITEIGQVLVRHRLQGEFRCPELKSQQIMECIHESFGAGVNCKQVNVTLIDDGKANCEYAESIGYKAIYIDKSIPGFKHLNDLACHLGFDIKDLSLSVANKSIRIETALVVTREREYLIEFLNSQKRESMVFNSHISSTTIPYNNNSRDLAIGISGLMELSQRPFEKGYADESIKGFTRV